MIPADQDDLGPDALPLYQGIARADVHLVHTPAEAERALAALLAADAVGFDTESKPTFTKGEQSTGPHLVQLATDEHVYLFQVDSTSANGVIKTVLESARIVKAGFGLGDDIKRLRAKLGIETVNVVDLANVLRNGQRNPVGAKTAVARFYGQTLRKSKRITTTNWATPRLSEQQILYAADDAHVALRIYRLWRAARPA
ncbi:MAG TPA: 3'-5' exonuclease [Telluria sp.]|nr:3'-5' exonuclease [Telluria sp.]